jgi:S1-C subfamily serine protease
LSPFGDDSVAGIVGASAWFPTINRFKPLYQSPGIPKYALVFPEHHMPSTGDFRVAAAIQPKAADYDFDLERTLASVVALSARVPEDAFTAEILGMERAGNAVVINDTGLVVTIGYLITEADQLWLRPAGAAPVPAMVAAYDQQSGFGLVQALERLPCPALPLGSAAGAREGDRVVVAGAGGRARSVAAHVVARQEFAGNWEYVLDDAIFTAPAHPNWGGAALIDAKGKLIGIGSLQLETAQSRSSSSHMNMCVPIDLLTPILDDLLKFGRRNTPPRPWLGLYAAEIEGGIALAGVTAGGPAARAGLEVGDMVVAVAGQNITSLAGLFRGIWSLGDAGVEVPLTIWRDGRKVEVRVTSADRTSLLKKPLLH